jgi:hypothetical protein
MSLDVYVGSLRRYYAGSWQTVVQQSAAFPVSVARGRAPAFERIQQGLKKALRSKGVSACSWDDDESGPYFTDKPGWYGYTALALLAAHAEHPDFPAPSAVPERLDLDPAWKASSGTGYFESSRYQQLLGAELWLPCDFDLVLFAELLDNNPIGIGSTHRLLAQLEDLNARTFQAAPEQRQRWLESGAEPSESFTTVARFALALFLELARKAVDHRLPMKLDY